MTTSNHAQGATLALRSSAVPTRRRTRPTPGTLARAWAVLRQWHQRAASRRELDALDEHLLADIGLTRQQVAAERSKFFWQE